MMNATTTSSNSVLIVKTESQEIRIPYSSISLSFENSNTSFVKSAISLTKQEESKECNTNEFESKLALLREKGYTNEKVNERVLRNQKGDLERTIKRLEFFREKKENKLQKINDKPIVKKYREQLDILSDKGYHKIGMNIRLLRQNNGDIDETIAQLNSLQEKRNFKKLNKQQSKTNCPNRRK
mmetsp:Transcript_14830/g.30816  ORF Transcript_14830/g.30816 Transcript_14830/m.30816 type:complete len:183 (-) Transcript_14830:5-553(-)